ncbi:MAG: ABC transporter permease [Chitinophagaceae bacterium]|nr:MAG: ABC transporter permease [Chitinophagaceae bacterium]
MFRNYFITTFRILMRNKLYSFINIAGLTIGLAACILILFYIQFEFGFDRYNKKANRIFRITENIQTPDRIASDATSPAPLAATLQSDFSGIEKTARMVQMSHFISAYHDVLVSYGPKEFYEKSMYFTDPSFFKIFAISLLKGNIKNGLTRPYTIFISSSIAQKYFGKNDPIGKTLDIAGSQPYEVTGVFKDFPPNSHIHADFLASFSSITSGETTSDWGVQVYTYILLKNKSDASAIQKRLSFIEKKSVPSSKDENISFSLMPLLRIHLYSRLRFEPEPQGNIKYLYLFGAIALLILIIACLNYINMSTARSTKRALETGVRKVMGASRAQLLRQYFFESFLLNSLAFAFAIALARLLLPYFNTVTGLPISFDSVSSLWIFIILGVVLCITSLLSGLYPAVLLSSFRPVLVLKGKIFSESGVRLRRGLVIFQFTASIILIICAIVLERQMKYIQNNMPGDKDGVVILIRNRDGKLKDYASFKTELLRNPQIESVTTTQFIPGFAHDEESFEPNDIEGVDHKVSLPIFYGDTSFVKTLGIRLIEGRNFSGNYPLDKQNAVLVNEAAVERFGWKEPVGKYIWFSESNFSNGQVSFSRVKKQVIGVVNDFHYQSLREMVSPVIIEMAETPLLYIAVQTNGYNVSQTLSFIKSTWKTFVPGEPMDYNYLKNDYTAMYRSDYLLGNIFRNFAMLAIIIACLGLFGLIAFTVERRTKEIGIRKVLGASVQSIVALLSREFVLLVLIAFVIASPIAWWIMNKWLQNFAYKIHIGWWIFLVAGVVAVLLALITVGFQAIKAAVANPVESLRTE